MASPSEIQPPIFHLMLTSWQLPSICVIRSFKVRDLSLSIGCTSFQDSGPSNSTHEEEENKSSGSGTTGPGRRYVWELARLELVEAPGQQPESASDMHSFHHPCPLLLPRICRAITWTMTMVLIVSCAYRY